MTNLKLDAPWLEFDLGQPMQALSWSINRPGFVQTSQILWREVSNADLPQGMDVRHWLAKELEHRNRKDAVVLLTSRYIERLETRTASAGDVQAQAVATVGLSNGERIGSRVDYAGRDWGTINVAVRLTASLSSAGLLEAMSIAVQARTAAVMDTQFELPTGIATGTGTDCVAIAAPAGSTDFAGLHTDIGETVGRAVYDAVFAGATAWKMERKETSYA
ncbi:adenosylcobinamide amidohydrolase [Tropicibacter sp. R16_0]|uniref:adenosylcobinamide amidohydrolase n=1 Tax=Tropicibacter sp. R16_0 TaxID=2821102 RepID=UPI001ADA98AB|nr:adenosylcobinamide amidohydrolase [Tropicibacter sp. R16_0]MBO9453497.1 adenosylcobinamide amidohydrolase [Tropicibacter sp. R16_0]